MGRKNFKKIIAGIIIIFVLSSFSPQIFIKKAEALSPGEAVGKAVGAGAVCFLETKIEAFGYGFLSRWLGEAAVENRAKQMANIDKVPVFTPDVEISKSVETSDALMKSKDCIRDVVSKIFLDWIVDETVTWIQGGGEPGFVQNWDNFSKDAFNVGIGEVISHSSFAFMCSPFKTSVRLSFLPVNTAQHKLGCTLDQVVNNIDNFYSDFSTGGWLAFNTMWQPQNNYFGAYMIASDQALIRATEKQSAALNEAISGKGFLSSKQCVKWDEDEYLRCVQVLGGSPEECESYKTCIQYNIVTPGDTVGTAVAKAVTSDSDWAANIKSWVGAVLNAVINRLTEEGLSLMKRSDDPSSSSSARSYDPWQGVDRTVIASENVKNQILEEMLIVQEDLEDINYNKGLSFSYFNDALLALQQYNANGCQPTIPSSELNSLEEEINSLIIQIGAIDALIYQFNELENYIAGLTAEQFMRAQKNIMDRLRNLASQAGQYGTVQNSVDELNRAIFKYDTATQQLSACSTSLPSP